jgi:hypothetical protein
VSRARQAAGGTLYDRIAQLRNATVIDTSQALADMMIPNLRVGAAQPGSRKYRLSLDRSAQCNLTTWHGPASGNGRDGRRGRAISSVPLARSRSPRYAAPNRGVRYRVMEFVFEIVLQFLGEILLQIIFEVLVELGLHRLGDTFKKPRSAVLSTIGFILWGAMAGGISLLVFPRSAISNIAYRSVNLIVTPLIAGGVMALIGRQRDKRGVALVRLDRFAYAFLFAFSMALVRFVWAR